MLEAPCPRYAVNGHLIFHALPRRQRAMMPSRHEARAAARRKRYGAKSHFTLSPHDIVDMLFDMLQPFHAACLRDGFAAYAMPSPCRPRRY